MSRYVQAREPIPDDVDLEGDFEPSLLNSAIYLLTLIQQISTFAINYQGRPFRESIRENRAMYWGLVVVAGIAFAGATEFVPELNERLKLVPFDVDFKVKLTAVMAVDYVGCWIVENVLKRAFSDYRPRDIAIRRVDQVRREEERKGAEKMDRERVIERKAMGMGGRGGGTASALGKTDMMSAEKSKSEKRSMVAMVS